MTPSQYIKLIIHYTKKTFIHPTVRKFTFSKDTTCVLIIVHNF